MVYNKKIMSHSNTESFYVTSSQLPIDMETESHPSGLVIFSRELTHGDGVTGHIIVSPKNHHTDIYSDYLGHNPQLVDERIRWGGRINQTLGQNALALNYYTKVEPAFGMAIAASGDYPMMLIAHTKNNRLRPTGHSVLGVSPEYVKMATQALGSAMTNHELLNQSDGVTRLIQFSIDELEYQQVTAY